MMTTNKIMILMIAIIIRIMIMDGHIMIKIKSNQNEINAKQGG